MARLPVLFLLLTLAACGRGATGVPGAGAYVGGSVPIECAPFARALSGIALSGPAADWWTVAADRYSRGPVPVAGSVLVLRRSARLPDGHVAVVSHVLSPRLVLVTQANWVRHRVTADQPVLDVSPSGDWSAVRVWWPPAGQMGTTDYPAWGFIRSGRPVSQAELAAGVPNAIRLALSGR
jgi:hypothetical protein